MAAGQQLVSFPLAIGMDDSSFDESVQPLGERPALVSSRNTRLSKLPGAVSKAPGVVALTGSIAAPCGGIVPCGEVDSSVAFFTASTSRRVTELRQSTLFTSSVSQSSLVPSTAEVVQAGALSGAKRYAPSVCYDRVNGLTWHAGMIAYDANTIVLTLSGVEPDGALRVANTVVTGRGTAFGGAPATVAWCAVSSHGANGAYFWWQLAPSATIHVAKITLTGLTVSLTGPVAVYTPAAAGVYALAYDSDDNSVAYLVTLNSASTSSFAVHRVTVPALGVTTVSIATGAVVGNVGAGYVFQNGVPQLAVVATNATPSSAVYKLQPATLATLWTFVGPATNQHVGVGFQQTNSGTINVLSAHQIAGVGAGVQDTSVRTQLIDGTAGTTLGFATLAWRALAAKNVGVHKASTGDLIPVVMVRPSYNTAVTYDVTDAAFVGDPCVELYRPIRIGAASMRHAIVARFGVDLSTRLDPGLAANNLVFDVNRCTAAYLAENIVDGISTPSYGYVARYVVLDFGARQPRYALTSDGAAVIAGALTACWDGSEYRECSATVAPKMAVGTLGAGLWPAGTYRFAAVLQWKDAQGQLHRSPPSAVVSFTAGAPWQPTFRVSVSAGIYQDEAPRPVIYSSMAGGTVLYAQNIDVTLPGALWTDLVGIAAPVQDAWHPALYSDGSATSPLANFAPNASRDVASVADRIWIVDAERQARAYFSLPKQDGVFAEFSPDLYVDFPASAGRLNAVSNLNSAPVFFTASGAWTVAGDGPDALNNPPYFSAPQQISNIACTQRNSVVSTPVGVMFVSNDRFVLLSPGGQMEFDSITAPASVVGTAVFRGQQEVAFFSSNGLVYVYNWSAKAWTIWDAECTGTTSITAAAQIPTNGTALFYDASGQRLCRLDPETVSTTARIRLETGWILLGGPQDDNVVNNLVLHGRYAGAHGVQMTIATDYGTAQPVKTWALADTLNTSLNSRYDLVPELRDMSARALKVIVQETDCAGEAFQPVNLTVELKKNHGRLHTNLRRSGRK